MEYSVNVYTFEHEGNDLEVQAKLCIPCLATLAHKVLHEHGGRQEFADGALDLSVVKRERQQPESPNGAVEGKHEGVSHP